MEFSRLDGDLDMDSGDMRASDLSGPFRLLTRSKDVRLSGVNGDVRLQNENGAVEIHMNKLGSMQVSNRNSDIQIYLPDKAGFQLDAHSRGGEIESDFDALKIDNGDDQATASGTRRRWRPAPGHQQRTRRNRTPQRIDGGGGAGATHAPAPHVPGAAKGSGAHRELGPVWSSKCGAGAPPAAFDLDFDRRRLCPHRHVPRRTPDYLPRPPSSILHANRPPFPAGRPPVLPARPLLKTLPCFAATWRTPASIMPPGSRSSARSNGNSRPAAR